MREKIRDALALIIASPIRMAIVDTVCNPGNPSNFEDIKRDVERKLGKEISDGSFIWHLENTLDHMSVSRKIGGRWRYRKVERYLGFDTPGSKTL